MSSSPGFSTAVTMIRVCENRGASAMIAITPKYPPHSKSRSITNTSGRVPLRLLMDSSPSVTVEIL
ncbi:MAG: hypothetical protein FJ267_08220 [Planctomycetes bacterium]|nr:hypothetical protein [Planctomycetota bacterium]